VQEEVQQDLVDLVDTRRQIAGIVGVPSYRHYRLQSSSLTQAPEHIDALLNTLKGRMQERAQEEIQRMEALGRRSQMIGKLDRLEIWDKWRVQPDYLQAVIIGRGMRLKAQEFSLRSALQTLFDVVRRLFEVTFVEEAVHEGCVLATLEVLLIGLPIKEHSCREGWASSLKKYRAICSKRDELGTIFLDLYQRPGKYTGNAHFTLQCGKALPDGSYRKPVVALACSYSGDSETPTSGAGSMLSFEEVSCLSA
jgi:Zn-dependent oligopeptidase